MALMDDFPRQALRELVATHGPALAADARRCEGLLRDFAGQHRREIFVLVNAIKEGVPADLAHPPAALPPGALAAQLSLRLQDHLGLTEEAAWWAVQTWALALSLPVSAERPAALNERYRGRCSTAIWWQGESRGSVRLGGQAEPADDERPPEHNRDVRGALLWVFGVAALWAAIGGSAGTLGAQVVHLPGRQPDWTVLGTLGGAGLGLLAAALARAVGGSIGVAVRWAVSGTVGGAAIGAAVAALLAALVGAILDAPGMAPARAREWAGLGATLGAILMGLFGAANWQAFGPLAREGES
jgi:hypothetical protein